MIWGIFIWLSGEEIMRFNSTGRSWLLCILLSFELKLHNTRSSSEIWVYLCWIQKLFAITLLDAYWYLKYQFRDFPLLFLLCHERSKEGYLFSCFKKHVLFIDYIFVLELSVYGFIYFKKYIFPTMPWKSQGGDILIFYFMKHIILDDILVLDFSAYGSSSFFIFPVSY